MVSSGPEKPLPNQALSVLPSPRKRISQLFPCISFPSCCYQTSPTPKPHWDYKCNRMTFVIEFVDWPLDNADSSHIGTLLCLSSYSCPSVIFWVCLHARLVRSLQCISQGFVFLRLQLGFDIEFMLFPAVFKKGCPGIRQAGQIPVVEFQLHHVMSSRDLVHGSTQGS